MTATKEFMEKQQLINKISKSVINVIEKHFLLDNQSIGGEVRHQTPNCAICKWFKDSTLHNTRCKAQGDNFTIACYSSDQCKSLFEVKPTEDKND